VSDPVTAAKLKILSQLPDAQAPVTGRRIRLAYRLTPHRIVGTDRIRGIEFIRTGTTATTVLDAVHAGRDPTWDVDVRVNPSVVRIGRDHLRFEVRSSRPGFLYVLMVGTDRSHFYQLFPNSLDGNNQLKANTTVRLPREGWLMKADGPGGTNRFVALIAPSPRDFSAAGLKATGQFSEFDLGLAERAFSTHGASAFAGAPVRCPGTAEFCAPYGAAQFEIREVN
jgi:hypothetical protein